MLIITIFINSAILLLSFFLSNYPIKVYTNKTSLLSKAIFGEDGVLLVSGRILFHSYKKGVFIRKSKQWKALYL